METQQDLLKEIEAVKTGHWLGVNVENQTLSGRIEDILKKMADDARKTYALHPLDTAYRP
jgi:protein gp37